MQPATCTNLHVRSPHDARIIFHAVRLGILPMVTRRLDSEERQMIGSGHVYVWEERGQNTELTGVGIERWTDGIRWGPSRVRDGFLFYQEKRERSQFSSNSFELDNLSISRHEQSVLNKQTYTVFVETPKGQRKWHLIAYFTQESLSRLKVIDDFPALASLPVPHGSYQSARHPKGRPEHIFNPQSEGGAEFVPYMPNGTPTTYHPQVPSPQATNFILWPNTRHPTNHQRFPSGRSSTGSESPSNASDNLAPLAYLETITPVRRHPEDEKTLMLLRPAPL